MLDSVNTNQPNIETSATKALASDYELNGTINRATNEGANFALIVAMLEQDCLHRPYLEQSKVHNQALESENERNHYRANPLSANETSWQTCQQTSQLVHDGQLLSAHLWLAMHPEPLSLRNKADAISEEVMANCSINTQTRLQQTKQNVMQVDETGLYDILNELEPAFN